MKPWRPPHAWRRPGAARDKGEAGERRGSYLRRVDSALLEGTVAGVLRAHVAVFAPVAGEVPRHARQAPAGGDRGRMDRVRQWEREEGKT